MIRSMRWMLCSLALGASPLMAQTVEYIHTDALGSPVAITDASGNVVERNVYEPYGNDLTGIKDGPGFTGHVSDAQTGLSYMQQRYYDPQIGRFLSVDPVTADGNMGGNFNRYWYANSNPYKFTDPDGRVPIAAPIIAGGIACARISSCRNFVIRWGGAAIAAAAGAWAGSQNNVLPIAQQSEQNESDSSDGEGGQSGSGEGGRVKTPNSGEPGSVFVNPNSGQERLYGEDGLPAYDVDHHADHGQGSPHDHEWTRDSDGRPVRGKAIPAPRRDVPRVPEPEADIRKKR